MNPNFLKVLRNRIADCKTKYHRPFSGPRRTFLGIHLYRKISALAWDPSKLLGRPPKPWNGVTFDEWERKIKKVVPWQYWWRYEFRPELAGYLKIFEVYYQEWLPDDRDDWSLLDYISSIELNYDNRIYKAIRSFKIRHFNDRLKPYNIVKIKTIDRHYRDPETVMIHAIFQIFCDFYELKGDQRSKYPVEIHDGVDVNKHWREWAEEAHEIYHWWKTQDKVYQLWEDKYDALDQSEENWHIKYGEIENAQAQETENYLIKVIKLRQGLWD